MHAYNANPGMVKGTAINKRAGGLMRLTAPLFKPFSASINEGVRTPAWLASAPSAPRPNGGFFSESRPDTPSRTGQNDVLARIVYDQTAALLGIDPLEREPGPASRA